MEETAEKNLTFTLTQFEGPLPFLIQLVRKYEIDISAICLMELVGQFYQYNPSFDISSHFARCASELVFLKSAHLLPAGISEIEEEEIIEDPLDGTIPILIDYCRFKDLAKELIFKEQQSIGRFFRSSAQFQTLPAPANLGIEHISLEELSLLFEKVLSKAQKENKTIHEENWKVSDKIKELYFLFNAQIRQSFYTIFSEEKSKEELIVLFLALLELIKRQFLRVIKDENGLIVVERKEGEPHGNS